MTTAELVQIIKTDAARPELYSAGHDVIIETLNDAQIAELVGPATTPIGARRRVGKWLRHDGRFLMTLRPDFYEMGYGTEYHLHTVNADSYWIWAMSETEAIQTFLEADKRRVWGPGCEITALKPAS